MTFAEMTREQEFIELFFTLVVALVGSITLATLATYGEERLRAWLRRSRR